MKNKNLKIILIMVILFIFLLGTQAFASIENTTEMYRNWQSLSDEEKQKYIEPSPFSLTIEDSVKKSVYNKFTREVGTSIQPSYVLLNDIDFNIKDQKSTNECWAFVTTNILETNIAKTRNKNIVLSPRHIDYATSRTFLDGINKKGYNREIGMGNFYISLSYCTSGQGPVLEENMPFVDNQNKVKLSEIDKEPAVKLENYVKFADICKKQNADGTITYTDGASTQYTEEQVNGVRNLIKEHIMKYGSVSAYSYLSSNISDYINTDMIQNGEIVPYYNNDTKNYFNHAISIIGWNDKYSKDNFKSDRKPTKDGAYLVLNSSGSTNGVLSLMAVSYEDVWIEYGTFGIISTSDINYDKIYQHDEYGSNMSLTMNNNATGENTSTGYIANVFKREEITGKEEYLNEVSIYVSKTSNVDIYVNTESNDKTKIKQVASAGILSPGYHTIKIATPLKLTGKEFVIAAKLSSDEVSFAIEANTKTNGLGSSFWDNATSKVGESFISIDGQNWTDLMESVKDSNICLKAFTTYQENKVVNVDSITLNKTEVEMKEGESTTLVATINPSNASNKNITWTSSDNKVAQISDTGIITALKEGTTTITAITEDGNKTATCKIIVKGKTDIDDEIYYPEEPSKDKDKLIEEHLKDKDKVIEDTTTAQGSIPQTGVKITLILVIVGIIGVIGIALIKIRIMKDIK